jgi:hypothetical protein
LTWQNKPMETQQYMITSLKPRFQRVRGYLFICSHKQYLFRERLSQTQTLAASLMVARQPLLSYPVQPRFFLLINYYNLHPSLCCCPFTISFSIPIPNNPRSSSRFKSTSTYLSCNNNPSTIKQDKKFKIRTPPPCYEEGRRSARSRHQGRCI